MQDSQFSLALKEFSQSTRVIFGDYAYAVGYYESFMDAMFHSLSPENQQVFLKGIQDIAANKKTYAESLLAQNKTLERT